MTLDTYDILRKHIGKPMSNRDWYELLMDEFKISKTQAKSIVHSMRRQLQILNMSNHQLEED